MLSPVKGLPVRRTSRPVRVVRDIKPLARASVAQMLFDGLAFAEALLEQPQIGLRMRVLRVRRPRSHELFVRAAVVPAQQVGEALIVEDRRRGPDDVDRLRRCPRRGAR